MRVRPAVQPRVGAVTLIRPEARSQDGRGISSALPRDVLERVRERLRLLALLLLCAFAIDPILFFGGWAALTLNEGLPPREFFRDAGFYWADIGVVTCSAGLWWVTRTRRVSATRLHIVGLLYEIAICFIIAGC